MDVSQEDSYGRNDKVKRRLSFNNVTGSRICALENGVISLLTRLLIRCLAEPGAQLKVFSLEAR